MKPRHENFQVPKKAINIKNFARKPLLDPPPFQGVPDPSKFFMFGPSFLFENTRKNPNIKIYFLGGGGGGS